MNRLQAIFSILILFIVLYCIPVFFQQYASPGANSKSECPETPHYAWGMIPQSKLDAPPCRLLKAYGHYTVILEGEDGQVFVAHGNHLYLPDDTHSSMRFVDWENYRQLEQNYNAVVMALIQPYCNGHGEARTILPNGVMSAYGGWPDYYPIMVNCTDGTRVTISDKLLQYTQDTSHAKE